MSSTAEVKDAIRMAQQYNIHIYKCLINGLVDSSLQVSKFRAELEEYTRSTMRFFDCLYQIRDSKIPFVRVREEQINAFKDHLKKNDYLRQEVHKVQRNLWNLREMGQRVPKADKHMIIQGFPELCVSTRPDNVPLTVLCDQIIHKYNLRNERPIMDMLRWANEQALARRTSNPDPIRTVVPKPKVKRHHPSALRTAEHDLTPVISLEDAGEINKVQPPAVQAEAHDVTPVMSWEDMDVTDSDQPPIEVDTDDPFKSRVFVKRTQEVSLNSVPSTSVLLAEMDGNATKAAKSVCQPITDDNLTSQSANCINKTIDGPQQAGMQGDEKMENAESNVEVVVLNNMDSTKLVNENVEDTQPALLSFEDIMFDSFLQEASDDLRPEYSNHQEKMEEVTVNKSTVISKNIGVQETLNSTFVKESKSEDSLNEIMSVLDDIPELDSEYIQPEKANFKHAHAENVFAPNAMTRLKAEIPAMPETQQQKEDAGEYRDEQYQNRYNPRSRNVLSWEELMKRFTKSSEATTTRADTNVNTGDTAVKPSLPDNPSLQTDTGGDQTHVVPSLCLSGAATLFHLHPAGTTNPAFSTEADLSHKVDKSIRGDLEGTPPAPITEVQRPLTKIKKIQPLVGCDRPHVYENRIKRRQHTPKNNTETMTAAEVLDYQKRREEQLQELEVKKLRTKNILNQQFVNNNYCKTAVHYYKMQNKPKVAQACKTIPAAVPSQYRPPVSKPPPNTVPCLNNQTSRKRPAISSGMSSLPAAKRPRKPRIILRIFKEESDWNVEQVIDRD